MPVSDHNNKETSLNFQMKSVMRKAWPVVTIAAALIGPANATEGGGGIYANGVENFLSRAMPPPGFYPIVYGTRYRATALRDNDGNDIAAAIGAFVPR
jgi:hypothetical protein